MNIFQRLSYSAGNIKGLYTKGIEDVFHTSGSHPSVGDESAWRDPYEWGSYLLDGKKPSSKVDFINSNEGWVYICVKLNFQAVGALRLKLYVAKESKGKAYRTIKTRPVERKELRRLYANTALDPWLTKAEEVEEVTEHPFIDLMRDVNPYHTSRDLKEFTTMFLDLTGECYWLMIKDGLGVPRQLWVIPSQYINPKYGDSLDKAIVGYVYKRGNVEIVLKSEDVVMFSYPNPKNIFTGFSCVKGVADAVYIQSQMNEFETAMFENRGRVGGVIEETEHIGKTVVTRVKEDLEQKHTGSKKAGKMMYLPRGYKFTKDAMTPTELNFIEGRKVNQIEICSSLDVPFGFFDPSATRANAEAAGYQHAKIGVLPRSERFADKVNEKVLPLFDEKLFCAFDDPVPQNRELILKEQIGRVKGNIMLINEARAEQGLEPIEGGDEMLVDNRLMPISALGATPPPEATEEEEAEQGRIFVEKVMKAVKERLK